MTDHFCNHEQIFVLQPKSKMYKLVHHNRFKFVTPLIEARFIYNNNNNNISIMAPREFTLRGASELSKSKVFAQAMGRKTTHHQ